jgi:hypothetical protein
MEHELDATITVLLISKISSTGAENLAPQLGFDPRSIQPVASRYTD